MRRLDDESLVGLPDSLGRLFLFHIHLAQSAHLGLIVSSSFFPYLSLIGGDDETMG